MPFASQRVYLRGGRDEVSADIEVLNLFTKSDKILQVAVALANNLSSLELCPRKTLAPSLRD